jgi:hypothetical protein
VLGDHAIGARNLEDVKAVMRCRHKSCQGWVAQDCV